MDSIFPRVAGWLLVALTAGPDAGSLVARLGSPRYAEREAATEELEKLGQSALPILRSARMDRDPEVKGRAEILLDSIERAMLARPVQIRLPFGRLPLPRLVDEIARAEGVPLTLEDEFDAPVLHLEIKDDRPRAFWPLMDQLQLVPQYETEPDFRRRAWRTPILKLVPRTGPAPAVFDHGPFRVLARPPALMAQPFDGGFRAPGIGRVPRVDREPELVIPLELMAEPRMTLRPSGPILVTEALDDRGENHAATARASAETAADFGLGERATSILPVTIRMPKPDRPGRALRRLKGVIPVEVEARKFEPTAIPLNVASPDEHRPVVCGGSVILVHSLAPQPDVPGGYALELTIRRDGPRIANLNARFANRRLMEVATDLERVWESTEIVDAQGRPFRFGAARPVGIDADNGARLVLPISPREGTTAPPTELRFHGQIRANVDVPFEFRDLAMP